MRALTGSLSFQRGRAVFPHEKHEEACVSLFLGSGTEERRKACTDFYCYVRNCYDDSTYRLHSSVDIF